MATRAITEGTFDLPMHPRDAIHLFTAEGERSWIPGWEASYPDPALPDDAVGTVFIQPDAGGQIVFVEVDCGPLWRRYARWARDISAGTVEVRCAEAEQGTTVAVTFDLTALTPAGEAWLDQWVEAWDIDVWRQWIVGEAAPELTRQ